MKKLFLVLGVVSVATLLSFTVSESTNSQKAADPNATEEASSGIQYTYYTNTDDFDNAFEQAILDVQSDFLATGRTHGVAVDMTNSGTFGLSNSIDLDGVVFDPTSVSICTCPNGGSGEESRNYYMPGQIHYYYYYISGGHHGRR